MFMGTLTIQPRLEEPICAGDIEPKFDMFIVNYMCSSLLVKCVHVRCTSSLLLFLLFSLFEARVVHVTSFYIYIYTIVGVCLRIIEKLLKL